MALQSSGAISVSDMRTEFGLSGAVSFSNLYRGGNVIRNNYGNNASVPQNGTLEFSDYYNLYKEGTIVQKIQNFESYKRLGMMTEILPGGSEGAVDYNDKHLNNPWAAPGSPQTCTNTQSRIGFACSEWTTVIGISASGSMSNRSNPISSYSPSYTLYNEYTDTHNGNANMATAQINEPYNELGSISYAWNRFNTWRWGVCFLILMPGKWEVNRDYTATGSGWGVNSNGIANNAPSLSMASNELMVYGRERGGDGFSQGDIIGTNVSRINANGWWYNTGNVGISWPSGGSSSASPYMQNEQPDGTWVFREVS